MPTGRLATDADGVLLAEVNAGDDAASGMWTSSSVPSQVKGGQCRQSLWPCSFAVFTGAVVTGVILFVTKHHATGGRGEGSHTHGSWSPPSFQDGPPHGKASAFDAYSFTRFWRPSANHSNVHGPYGGNILTLHGLWPQYNHERCMGTAAGGQQCYDWPQYCGATQEGVWPSLGPLATEVLAELAPSWRTLAPEFLRPAPSPWGPLTLAEHEWQKHGTCVNPIPPTGRLPLGSQTSAQWQRDYFRLMLALAQNYSTPTKLQSYAASAQHTKPVERGQVYDWFGGPTDSVALQCDGGVAGGEGRLTMVSLCFSHTHGSGQDGMPQPQRVACSRETCLGDDYDNSCANHTKILVGPPPPSPFGRHG